MRVSPSPARQFYSTETICRQHHLSRKSSCSGLESTVTGDQSGSPNLHASRQLKLSAFTLLLSEQTKNLSWTGSDSDLSGSVRAEGRAAAITKASSLRRLLLPRDWSSPTAPGRTGDVHYARTDYSSVKRKRERAEEPRMVLGKRNDE